MRLKLLAIAGILYWLTADAQTTCNYATPGNPTGVVGLSAVNGSAVCSFPRADSAPALSQSISPNWTGAHTWSPASGTPITVNEVPGVVGIYVRGGNGGNLPISMHDGHSGSVGQYSFRLGLNATNDFEIYDDVNSASRMQLAYSGAWTVPAPGSATPSFTVNGPAGTWAGEYKGSSTTGQSYGLAVFGGTNASDAAFDVVNQSGSSEYLRVYGNGGVTIGGVANQGPGTLNVGTGIYVNGSGFPSLAASQTWTGTQSFANPSNVSLIADGVANFYAAQIFGSSTASHSYGLYLAGGTNASDYAAVITNTAQSQDLMLVHGDGGITVGTGAADEGAGTINATGGIYTNGVQLINNNITHGSNSNGYWRKNAADGQIEQWGTASHGGSDPGSITFPIAFTSAGSVVVTAIQVYGGNGGLPGVNMSAATTTGVATYYSGGFLIQWHAVGY